MWFTLQHVMLIYYLSNVCDYPITNIGEIIQALLRIVFICFGSGHIGYFWNYIHRHNNVKSVFLFTQFLIFQVQNMQYVCLQCTGLLSKVVWFSARQIYNIITAFYIKQIILSSCYIFLQPQLKKIKLLLCWHQFVYLGFGSFFFLIPTVYKCTTQVMK